MIEQGRVKGKENFTASGEKLSPEEILHIFDDYPSSGQEVSNFVEEGKLVGAKIRGYNVILGAVDHDERELPPFLEYLIHSPDTKFLLAEYYLPELLSWYGDPFIRKILKSKFFGPFKKNMWDKRLEFSELLAREYNKAKKVVVCADIAGENPFLYSLLREAWRHLAFFGGNTVSLMKPGWPHIYIPLIVTGYSWVLFMLNAQLAQDKGIFDKDKINNWEGFVFDLEQLRRILVARGIEQIIDEYPLSGNVDTRRAPQIVGVYPKAHAIRIIDYLTNPSETAHRLAEIQLGLFKRILPLGFSVRQWKYTERFQELSKSGYRWGESDLPPDEISKNNSLVGSRILFSQREIL